jgi:hypothetical protein
MTTIQHRRRLLVLATLAGHRDGMNAATVGIDAYDPTFARRALHAVVGEIPDQHPDDEEEDLRMISSAYVDAFTLAVSPPSPIDPRETIDVVDAWRDDSAWCEAVNEDTGLGCTTCEVPR